MDLRLATQALLCSLCYRVVNTHKGNAQRATPLQDPVRKQTAFVLMLIRNVGKLNNFLSQAQNRHSDAVSG